MGSGFGFPDAVYVEVNVGADKPTIPVGGALTTSAGTFNMLVRANGLPVALAPGVYTIMATASDGSVATHPLVVCAGDSVKC